MTLLHRVLLALVTGAVIGASLCYLGAKVLAHFPPLLWRPF